MFRLVLCLAAVVATFALASNADAQGCNRNSGQVSQNAQAAAPTIVQLPAVQAPIAASQSVNLPSRVAVAPLSQVAPLALAATANPRVVQNVSNGRERLLDRIAERRAEARTIRSGGTVVKQTTLINGA